MSKQKILTSLIITALLVPQITFAAWWNPFSWGWFKKQEVATTNSSAQPVNASDKSNSQAASVPANVVATSSISGKQNEKAAVIAYITAVNGNTVSLDYVEPYTGEEADKKMIEDGKCEKKGECLLYPPFIYYRNENKQIRTFTVSPNVVISDARDRKVTLSQVASSDYMVSKLIKEGKYSKNPTLEVRSGPHFEVTFNNKNEVSSLKEIFTP